MIQSLLFNLTQGTATCWPENPNATGARRYLTLLELTVGALLHMQLSNHTAAL